MEFLDLEGLKTVATSLGNRFKNNETRIDELSENATSTQSLAQTISVSLGAHISDKTVHYPFLPFTEILEDTTNPPAIEGTMSNAPAPDIIYDRSNTIFKKRSYVRHPSQTGYLRTTYTTDADTKFYNDDDQFVARTGILFMDSQLRMYTFNGTLEGINPGVISPDRIPDDEIGKLFPMLYTRE